MEIQSREMDLSRDILAIQDTMAQLLPANVSFSITDTRQMYPLFGLEALGNVTDKRLREFSAGRHAARQAMASHGRPQVAIPVHLDRGPKWPVGVVGAITHSAPICIAVIGKSKDYRGLGIDIASESDRPEPQTWPLFLQPTEMARLDRWATGDARAFLCAKEAAIKMIRDAFGRTLSFQSLCVHLTPDNSQFEVALSSSVQDLPSGLSIKGALKQVLGYQLAFCALVQKPMCFATAGRR